MTRHEIVRAELAEARYEFSQACFGEIRAAPGTLARKEAMADVQAAQRRMREARLELNALERGDYDSAA